jgi:hypothetical protein
VRAGVLIEVDDAGETVEDTAEAGANLDTAHRRQPAEVVSADDCGRVRPRCPDYRWRGEELAKLGESATPQREQHINRARLVRPEGQLQWELLDICPQGVAVNVQVMDRG